jgi:hypothetical protein
MPRRSHVSRHRHEGPPLAVHSLMEARAFAEFAALPLTLPLLREAPQGDGHPVLLDSSRIDLRTYIRLSENWGFGTRHELELDDSTLEEQIYSVHRDLGNWVAGMGISSRDNRFEQEYGLVFSLTLKDFPSVSLPFELDAQ